jgi:benzoyl-CoA 2,3-dioxygenase component A
MGAADIIKQHLIDPEICIRCNTCEDTCPIDAITHDDRNYVVKADVCNACMHACRPAPPAPSTTGARCSRARPTPWKPVDLGRTAGRGAAAGSGDRGSGCGQAGHRGSVARQQIRGRSGGGGQSAYITRAPWSAAHPYVNLHGVREPVTAGGRQLPLTAEDASSDIHHIVLDFGNHFFPVLEGQAIGIVPPGTDASGKPHYIRMYSVASPRDGERPGYNNLALTVKRVDTDHDGNPVRGVASNFLCDLAKGDPVQVVGPFGSTFLMPNHREASVMMICTGTGSAPMRAMTERMRRNMDHFSGRRLLFFGARNRRELPYFGPLLKLPKDFLDIHFAFSRDPECHAGTCRTPFASLGPGGRVAGGPTWPYLHLRTQGDGGRRAGCIRRGLRHVGSVVAGHRTASACRRSPAYRNVLGTGSGNGIATGITTICSFPSETGCL